MKTTHASLILVLLLAGCGSSSQVPDAAAPLLGDGAQPDVAADLAAPIDAARDAAVAPDEAADVAPQVAPPIVFPADDLACTTSADCCTVANACGDGQALVTAKNRDATAAAFAALGAHRRAAHDGGIDPDCWPCVAPAVEVSCQAGRCVAERVPARSGFDNLSALIAPHCGSILGLDGGTTRTVAPIRSALSLDAGATPPQPPVGGQPPVIGCH
jgi:hypothetical protein